MMDLCRNVNGNKQDTDLLRKIILKTCVSIAVILVSRVLVYFFVNNKKRNKIMCVITKLCSHDKYYSLITNNTKLLKKYAIYSTI